MLERLSDFIVCRLSDKKVIDTADIDCYKYGIVLLLSKVIITSIIALLALITQTFLVSVLFAVAFTFLRRYSGGYHCDSADSCVVVSIAVYILFLAAYELHSLVFSKVLFIFAVATFPVIYLISPLDSDNKPLAENERIKFQKISRTITTFLLFLTAIFFFLSYIDGLYITGYVLSADAILLLLGLLKERRKRGV